MAYYKIPKPLKYAARQFLYPEILTKALFTTKRLKIDLQAIQNSYIKSKTEDIV